MNDCLLVRLVGWLVARAPAWLIVSLSACVRLCVIMSVFACFIRMAVCVCPAV